MLEIRVYYLTNVCRCLLSRNRGTTSSDLLGVNSVALLSTLVGADGEELGVVSGSLLGGGNLGLLNSKAVTLALECDGGDEALDLGGLPLALAALLGGNLTVDDELTDVVLLGEVEELADLAGALGAEATGDGAVGKPGDGGLTRLGDDEGKGAQISTNDASTDGLATALTSAAGAVARVTSGEEEAGTASEEDTLLHGETLLVVTTGDLEDEALPLVAEEISLNLLTHTLIVERAAKKWDKHRLQKTYGHTACAHRQLQRASAGR